MNTTLIVWNILIEKLIQRPSCFRDSTVLIKQSHYLLHYSSIFSPIRIVRYSIWNYCCKDFGKVKMIVLGLILIIGQRKMLFMSLWFRPRTTPKLLYYYKTYWKSIMRKRCQNVCHPSWGPPHSFENTYIVCNIDHIITLRIEYRK